MGRYVEIGSQTNSLRTDLAAPGLRSVRLSFWAMNPTTSGGSVYPRAIVRVYRSPTIYTDVSIPSATTNPATPLAAGSAWTRYEASFGMHAAANGFRIWLYSTNNGPIRYSDIRLVKI